MRNQFPADRMLRERIMGAEARHPLIPPGHADPAGALDRIGEQLVKLLALDDRRTALLRHLYLRYVAACEGHGVQARAYRPPRSVWWGAMDEGNQMTGKTPCAGA